jgi:hypothetical protein
VHVMGQRLPVDQDDPAGDAVDVVNCIPM